MTSNRIHTPLNILITGATSGIGRDAALSLAADGHRVFATGRNEARLASLESQADGTLTALPLDVTDSASISSARTAIAEATAGHGVDVLINNAGYGHLAPAELITDTELRAQFETNVFGLMAVTRAFLPDMKRRGSGRILNVSSIGGRLTMPLAGAYSATKYAVESLSDAMRNELRPLGIHVVLIEPGPIATSFASTSSGIAQQYVGRAAEYETIVARAAELEQVADRLSAPPSVVTRAIRRAIASRSPRARYVAPFSSSVALTVASLVPTRLRDWFMQKALQMTSRGRLRAPATS